MSATLLDGRTLVPSLKQEIATEAAALIAEGCAPRLATLAFAGDEPAAAYIRRLAELCDEMRIAVVQTQVAADISTEQAVEALRALNDDSEVTGILILLPPPPQIDVAALLEALDPDKDVDGAHPRNAAALYLGTDGSVPATALAVLELLRHYEVQLSGKHAVVVGRSNVIGKPVALLLLKESATVTICHSRTKDLGAHTRTADVLIAAAGKPGLIIAEMVTPGSTVVDVGTTYEDGKLVGDVAHVEVAARAARLTPVPGGVGPLTNLMLMRNLIELTRRRSTSGTGTSHGGVSVKGQR